MNATDRFLAAKGATRGRLIKPGGTGKGLTACWITEALEARSIIVAVRRGPAGHRRGLS